MTLLGRWATNLGNLLPTGGSSGMLHEWQCVVVGCDVLETDDVRAHVYDDLEDKDSHRG